MSLTRCFKNSSTGREHASREVCEERNFSQVRVQRTLAIELIELFLRRLRALEHVQHVAEDFQHLAIVARRDDRRRPRVLIHASHFAEDHVFAGKLRGPTAALVDQRRMRIASRRSAGRAIRCSRPLEPSFETSLERRPNAWRQRDPSPGLI